MLPIHYSYHRAARNTPPFMFPSFVIFEELLPRSCQFPPPQMDNNLCCSLVLSCVPEWSCKKVNQLNKSWFNGAAANQKMLPGKTSLNFADTIQIFTLRTRWNLRGREVI